MHLFKEQGVRDAAAAIPVIVGMDDDEGLDQLLDHAVEERHQYRHKWQPGDVVMWDNRCLLHKANGDYDLSRLRCMYRVMLQGDAPR